MFRYNQKSIAVTLGVAIISTNLFAGVATYAQGGTPTPTISPVPTVTPITTPVKMPAGGKMAQPDVKMPAGGTMAQPATTTTPAEIVDPAKKSKKVAPKSKTIAELTGTSKNFKTLAAALKAADLIETLEAEGPYTVFAPTDNAFAKLPKGTLANLLKPENKEQLKKLLTYHVVAGAVTSKMLKAGQVETVEGSKITVKIRNRKVMINKANVILADVKASNGVIHAIDTVIMPPTK